MKKGKLCIRRGIYYRLYDNKCYVWNTRNQKQYVFNSVVYEILELIKLHIELRIEDVIQKFSSKYSESELEVTNVFVPFLESLQGEGIISIESKYNSIDIEQEVSQTFADKKILFSVLFETTYKCNERCQHCYVDSSCYEERKELSTCEVKHIIDNLYRANVGEITFSGGEFFARNDAVEIIEYASQKSFLINIFSNGTLLNSDMILRIARCDIRSYHTSLYGSTAETHDKITGIPGSFEKTIHTLKAFSELGVSTCVKTTMMTSNAHEYDGLLRLCQELKCEIQVGLSIMPTMLKNNMNAKFRLDIDELREITIKEMNRFDTRSVEKLELEEKGICSAGYSSITINPYGDILICTGIPIVLGNAVVDEIVELWNSSTLLLEWRKKTVMDISCMKTCQYAEYCSFCPAQAYLETGNCFGKYEEACMLAKTQYQTEEVKTYGEQGT